jgi:hypothetical protein
VIRLERVSAAAGDDDAPASGAEEPLKAMTMEIKEGYETDKRTAMTPLAGGSAGVPLGEV